MGFHVMIVNDNEPLRKTLKDMIHHHFPDHETSEAKDGEEGVDMAIKNRPDLILMDINMPKMSGIEATRIIKSFLPSVHIVIISGNNEEKHRQDARESGASGYIVKDLIFEQLQSLLTGLSINGLKKMNMCPCPPTSQRTIEKVVHIPRNDGKGGAPSNGSRQHDAQRTISRIDHEIEG